MIKPFGEHILIEPSQETSVSESGDFVDTEETSDVPVNGKVVDFYGDHNLEIGQKIWFKMWAGEDIKYEGKLYKLVLPKDIIAVEGGESD